MRIAVGLLILAGSVACESNADNLPREPNCPPQERVKAVERRCRESLEDAAGRSGYPRYEAVVCCARVYIEAGFADGLVFMAETVLNKPFWGARDPSTISVDDDTLDLAYAWYEAAARRGLAAGYLGMADIEFQRSTAPDDEHANAALRLLREADRRGSGAAALSLGTALLLHGDKRGRTEGLGALRRAVQRKTTGATVALASALLGGKDHASVEEAVRLLHQAYAFGEPYAAEMLGVLYHEGRAVPKDDKLALVWLGRAFEGRDADDIVFPPDAPEFRRRSVEIYRSLKKRKQTAPGPEVVPKSTGGR